MNKDNSDNDVESLRSKIWLTSRTRMCSEKRYLRYNLWTNLLLTYYALILIITSLFIEDLENISHFNQINTSLAMMLFALTLITSASKFEKTAEMYRECYLKCQRILDEKHDRASLSKAYHDILELYANHDTKDFNDFLVQRTVFKSDEIYSGEDKKEAGFLETVSYMSRLFIFYFSIFTLFFTPPLIIGYKVFCSAA